MRRTTGFLAVVAIAVGALLAPAAAHAALPDQVTADREFVRWLSVRDPQEMVRSQARSALLHSSGAAAITTFITTGYPAAVGLAGDRRDIYRGYADRMAQRPASAFPFVNSAANRALRGTDLELAEFYRTGYTAAAKNDQDPTKTYDDGAAYVTEYDRDFLTGLATTDLSAVVQSRAGAVQSDAEVAEFLRHGWFSASGLERDALKARYVLDERQWWGDLRERIADARAADEVARAATGEAVEPARADAALAWDAVSAQTGPAIAAWAGHEQTTTAYVAAWLHNTQLARATPGPLWAEFAAKAPAERMLWLAEQRAATERSAWWANVNRTALDAAAAWRTPVEQTATR